MVIVHLINYIITGHTIVQIRMESDIGTDKVVLICRGYFAGIVLFNNIPFAQ